MKTKLICMLFMLVLTFALSACSGGQDDNTQKSQNDIITTQPNNSIPADKIDNNITKPENVGGDTRPKEPNDNDKDAVKPQDGTKEKSGTESDTGKKVNNAIPFENHADNSSKKSKDIGQQSVTVEIFDSSATPQKRSSNLNANGGENEKSDTQMTESKNETILSK
jgi:hypothetical protein